jgi:uncharacterized protein (TIGR03067 family)
MVPLLCLVLCSAATHDAPPDAKKELAKLEGTWREIGGEEVGRVETAEEAKGEEIEFIFKGNVLTIRKHGKVEGELKVSLDPSKDPKELDLEFTEGKGKGKKCLAIYSLEGDRLRICTNTKLRPTDDEQRPNVFGMKKAEKEGQQPGLLLFILERQK